MLNSNKKLLAACVCCCLLGASALAQKQADPRVGPVPVAVLPVDASVQGSQSSSQHSTITTPGNASGSAAGSAGQGQQQSSESGAPTSGQAAAFGQSSGQFSSTGSGAASSAASVWGPQNPAASAASSPSVWGPQNPAAFAVAQAASNEGSNSVQQAAAGVAKAADGNSRSSNLSAHQLSDLELQKANASPNGIDHYRSKLLSASDLGGSSYATRATRTFGGPTAGSATSGTPKLSVFEASSYSSGIPRSQRSRMVRSSRRAGYHPRERHGTSRRSKHSERCTDPDSRIGGAGNSPEEPCGHDPNDPFMEDMNPLKQLSSPLVTAGLKKQQ